MLIDYLVPGALLGVAAILAFLRPQIAQETFAALETRLCALAQRPLAALVIVVVASILLRLLVVALIGWPQVHIADEFSMMLKVDTLLHGRFANSPQPFGAHFETVYVHQTPSYGSMYFPGRAFAPLLGTALFGEPGVGVMLMMAVTSGAMLWALRGWTSPALALLGASVFVIAFALIGPMAHQLMGIELGALGGILVLGAYPRLMKKPRWRDASLAGLGVFLLIVNRPFEGMFFCLPFALLLAVRLFSLITATAWTDALRLAMPPLVFAIAGLGLTLADNQANTGDPLVAPYQLNRIQHAHAPTFITSDYNVPTNPDVPPHAARAYDFELGEDLDRSLERQARKFAVKLRRAFLFYLGPILLVPFVFGLPGLLRRPVAFAAGVSTWVGMAFIFFTWPYYVVPVIGVVLLSIALGFGQMRRVAWRGRQVGVALSRLLVVALIVSMVVEIGHNATRKPEIYRSTIEARLEQIPGRDLVIVRPAPDDSPLVQWVYNRADINAASIVWVNDLGSAENRRLLEHFSDREVWTLNGLDPSGLVRGYDPREGGR